MKKIDFNKIDDVNIVTPFGELTFSNIDDLSIFLKEQINKNCFKIVYDMGSVTWIDSLGLGMIAKSVKYAILNNTRVCIVKPSDNIIQILKLCSLINLVKIFDDIEQSVDFLNS